MRRATRFLLAATLVAASLTPAGRPVRAAESINLFGWSEYIPQSVIDDFTKESGIEVNYEMYASNEEMLAKLFSVATKYDLIQPSEYTVEALVKGRSLMAWLLTVAPKAPGRIARAVAGTPSGDEHFLRVFGAPPDAVDRRWRLWALRP